MIDYDPDRDTANRLQIAELALVEWKNSLCREIPVSALYSRSPKAHKWKATFRSLLCRELTFWRLTDILSQVILLRKADHMLGAIILLRSCFETMGLLTYLNLKIDKLLKGKIDFTSFDEITNRIMSGSKLDSTDYKSINIITILKQCDKKYPGIWDNYEFMSELTHPNSMGLTDGYSSSDPNELISSFKIQFLEHNWIDIIENGILSCMMTFEEEYNNVFPRLFEKLEKWLEENDETLEKERNVNI